MEEECETPEKEQTVDDCRIQEVRNPWRFASISRSRDWSVLENSSGSGVVRVEDIGVIGEGDLLVPDSSKSSSDSKASPAVLEIFRLLLNGAERLGTRARHGYLSPRHVATPRRDGKRSGGRKEKEQM